MENTENKSQGPPRFYYVAMWLYIVVAFLFVWISIDMRFDRARMDREVRQLEARLESELVRVQAIHDRLVLLKEMGIIPDNINELIREWEEAKQKE